MYLTKFLKFMTTTTKPSNLDLIKLTLLQLRKNMGSEAAKLTDEHLNLFAEFGDQLSQGKICLKAALKIPKSQLDMFYTMAYDFYQRDKYEKAETIFSLLVLLDPLEENYWEGFGATAKQLKNFDIANMAYATLIQIKPKRAIYYLDLAECFFLNKQIKEAIHFCELMLFIAKSFPKDNPNITTHIQKAKLFLNALKKKVEA